MNASRPFRQAEQASATDELAKMAVGLRDEDLPDRLASRAADLLVDLLAVTLSGSRTLELRRLADAVPCPPGESRTLGSTVSTTPESACFLDAVAACCLELDEGNKHAAGHPAAHVVFAAVAAARLADRPVTGRRFLAAVVAGYEVASRFGHALDRDPGWHTHGHWGVTGAATAASLVLGADERQVGAAIDASTALAHVAAWPVVLEGGFVRNLWIAGANRAGIDAARLALADLVVNSGAAQHSLGTMVGTLDPARLTEGLGEDWLVLQGYAKQHSSCSYTHAVIDVVQELRRGARWDVNEVVEVEVRIHHLAAPLLQEENGSRLGAMFSLPFVTAMAMVSDQVDPAAMDPASEMFSRARQLSASVRVKLSPHLDVLLPGRRAAEVAIRFTDGTTLALGAPNPIGDADQYPFGRVELRAKAVRLVGEPDTARIEDVVEALAGSADVVGDLDLLP